MDKTGCGLRYAFSPLHITPVIEVGEEAEPIIGIINHDRKAMSYSVAIRAGGVDIGRLEPILLEPLEKLERIVFFTINKPRERQKVEFHLY